MKEREIFMRKSKLKRQAIRLLWEGIQDLKNWLFLLSLCDRLSAKIDRTQTRELSTNLDAVTFLAEFLRNAR